MPPGSGKGNVKRGDGYYPGGFGGKKETLLDEAVAKRWLHGASCRVHSMFATDFVSAFAYSDFGDVLLEQRHPTYGGPTTTTTQPGTGIATAGPATTVA